MSETGRSLDDVKKIYEEEVLSWESVEDEDPFWIAIFSLLKLEKLSAEEIKQVTPEAELVDKIQLHVIDDSRLFNEINNALLTAFRTAISRMKEEGKTEEHILKVIKGIYGILADGGTSFDIDDIFNNRFSF